MLVAAANSLRNFLSKIQSGVKLPTKKKVLRHRKGRRIYFAITNERKNFIIQVRWITSVINYFNEVNQV